MEGNKKQCYKILSFKYDFLYENDTVQFSYHMPYTYEMMTNFIKEISSPKVRLRLYESVSSKVYRVVTNEKYNQYVADIELRKR